MTNLIESKKERGLILIGQSSRCDDYKLYELFGKENISLVRATNSIYTYVFINQELWENREIIKKTKGQIEYIENIN